MQIGGRTRLGSHLRLLPKNTFQQFLAALAALSIVLHSCNVFLFQWCSWQLSCDFLFCSFPRFSSRFLWNWYEPAGEVFWECEMGSCNLCPNGDERKSLGWILSSVRVDQDVSCRCASTNLEKVGSCSNPGVHLRVFLYHFHIFLLQKMRG